MRYITGIYEAEIEILKKIRNHFLKNDKSIFSHLASKVLNDIIKDSVQKTKMCDHVNTYPIDRFGNSKCHDCGCIIKDNEC